MNVQGNQFPPVYKYDKIVGGGGCLGVRMGNMSHKVRTSGKNEGRTKEKRNTNP